MGPGEYPIHLCEMSTNSRSSGPIVLSAGDAEVTVDPDRGGRVASWRIAGSELLLGRSEAPEGSIRWGSFLMAPWPGRLAGGRLRWRGRTWQLQRTHGHHAIHGLVHGAPWVVDAASDRTVSLSVELGPLGWPFAGRVQQRITLTGDRLRLDAEITADQPMPAALGWHPWFLRRGADPHVCVASSATLATQGMIPTGELVPVDARTDLRRGPLLGRRRLDHVYVDATSPATITWPDLTLTLAFEPPLRTVVVHTPANAFCVEPQTAWPNALGEPADRPGSGVRDLAAGERLGATLEVRWAR